MSCRSLAIRSRTRDNQRSHQRIDHLFDEHGVNFRTCGNSGTGQKNQVQVLLPQHLEHFARHIEVSALIARIEHTISRFYGQGTARAVGQAGAGADGEHRAPARGWASLLWQQNTPWGLSLRLVRQDHHAVARFTSCMNP